MATTSSGIKSRIGRFACLKSYLCVIRSQHRALPQPDRKPATYGTRSTLDSPRPCLRGEAITQSEPDLAPTRRTGARKHPSDRQLANPIPSIAYQTDNAEQPTGNTQPGNQHPINAANHAQSEEQTR